MAAEPEQCFEVGGGVAGDGLALADGEDVDEDRSRHQMARQHEAVAAVVASAAHDDHVAVGFVAQHLGGDLGGAEAGVFHQDDAGDVTALDGVRVAFLTDLHLSSLVPASDVANAVAVANAERADFVVLGGDYVSFAERRYMEPVAELLAPLTAPHGVFAILGNHDDDRYMPAALRRRRIDVLADDRTTLTIRGERLELAGLKFWTKGLDDIASVLEGAAAPLILAAHDPRRIVEAAELRVGGVLAGHTHGGQIVLPLVGLRSTMLQ